MIDKILSTLMYFIFFLAIFATIIWVTGFIGSIIASVGEADEGKKENFLIIAWAVACFALTVLVCGLIFGG